MPAPLRQAIAAALLAIAACSSAPRPAPEPAAAASPPDPPPLAAEAYGHYLRARLASIEGDPARSADELRAAAAAAPGQAAIRVALAEALLRAGRRDEAVREIEAAHARFPLDAGVWRESGRVYRRAGRDADAARAYQRGLELDPDDEAAHLGLASVWLALGQPARSEAAYRALLARRPHAVAGHYRLGLRLLDRGDLAAAERSLRRAVDLDPAHVGARVGLARALRARGRSRDAVVLLREAFDRSSSVEVGQQLFEQLLEVGERAAAVAMLGQLDRDDLEVEVRASFVSLYLQVGEAEAARRLAVRLLAREPGSGPLRLLEARALGDLGRRPEAVRALLSVADDQPVYPVCRALAAELLARDRRAREARAALAPALTLFPRDVDLLVAQALVAELAGRAGEARARLRAAIDARAPGVDRRDDLVYALATLEDRQGKPDTAVALAQRILDRDPDHAAALNFIGFSLADRRRELPRAERMLRRALELSPTDGYVLDSMGWLRFRQGRLDEARDLLERAARMAPAEPEIYWHLGELERARGQIARAVELYRRAVALEPDAPVRARLDERLRALDAAARPGGGT